MHGGGCAAVLTACSHKCAVQMQVGTLLGYLTKFNGKCPMQSVQQSPPLQHRFPPGVISYGQYKKQSVFTQVKHFVNVGGVIFTCGTRLQFCYGLCFEFIYKLSQVERARKAYVTMGLSIKNSKKPKYVTIAI